MRKPIILLLCLILCSFTAYAGIMNDYSKDRTKYIQYNDSIYLFDDMNNSLLDGTSNIAAANNTNARTRGWQGSTTGSNYLLSPSGNMPVSHIVSSVNGAELHAAIPIGNVSMCVDILYDSTWGNYVIFNFGTGQHPQIYAAASDCVAGHACAINDADSLYVDLFARNNQVNTTCMIWNETEQRTNFYINDKYMGVYSSAAKGRLSRFDVLIYNSMTVRFTNFRVWNMTLYGKDGPPAAASVPGIPANPTLVTPLNNDHTNVNTSINCTHPGSDIQVSLYVNDNVYFRNQALTNGLFNWTSNFSDGAYTIKCSALNTSSSKSSVNNVSSTFYIDSIEPFIYMRGGNSFNASNDSILNTYLQNLFLNFTFQDDNLGEVLLNITNSTGKSVYSYYNSSTYFGSNITHNLTKSIDSSTWGLGEYQVLVQSSDLHTKNSIKAYDVRETANNLRFITEEGITINLEILSQDNTQFKANKKEDRYEFDVKFSKIKGNIIFRLTSSELLQYIENSEKYNAHFVTRKGIEGNWIDLNSMGLTKKDYTVTKINEKTYDITVNNVNKKDITFTSIGGLNVNTKAYRFYVGAVADFLISEAIIGSLIPVTINYSNQSQTAIANQTIRFVGILPGINNFTLNSSGRETLSYSYNFSTNYVQINLNLTPIGVQIYFYDEINGNLITGESFNAYVESTGYSQTFTDIITNPYILTNLSIGTYKIKVYNNNYPYRQRLDLPITASSGVNINMYLVNSSESQQKFFTVVDNSLTNIENARLTVKRIVNGTYAIVHEANSDFVGGISFYMDPNNLYKLNFSKSGYQTIDTNLEPVSNSYTVTMRGLATYNVSQNFDKVSIYYYPIIFYDSKLNNFTFKISSNDGILTDYRYNLSYPGGYSAASGSTATGETLKTGFTILGATIYDRVTLTYSYTTSTYGSKSFTQYYSIDLSNINGTMTQNTNKTYGLGVLERALILVFVVIIVVGIATLIGQPVAGFVLGLFIMGYFVYIGFISIWYIAISCILGLIIVASRSDIQ